ncbi:MAG: sugar transferase [Burkholderiaceae bacterium]|nr:sugar transferase [Burkholderiaceae bacterium]
MAKRIFDLCLASLALLLLAPLMLLIALCIKLDSGGPVFYRQQRVGRHGALFRIHKFRTMQHNPRDAGAQITVGGDARITRVGEFLRGSKLDELAQLIDVMQGTMSLVGPRPEVPRYVAHYPADLRSKLLSVRPGITDMASLTFHNESELLAQSEDPDQEYVQVLMPKKLALAAQYVDAASLRLDVKILWRTLCLLLSPAKR